MEGYGSKHKVLLKCCGQCLSAGRVEKLICTKNGACWHFPAKSKITWIFMKTISFWKMCFFHQEMFDITNCLLDLVVCIVYMVIVNKNCKLFYDNFSWIAEDAHHDNFIMMTYRRHWNFWIVRIVAMLLNYQNLFEEKIERRKNISHVTCHLSLVINTNSQSKRPAPF